MNISTEERKQISHIMTNNLTITTDSDVNFERKLDEITTKAIHTGSGSGRRHYLKDHLLNRITRENCLTIINYILAMQVEINPSERYRLDTIAKLKQLAEFHNPKPFQALERQDILSYLDRLRKPEAKDPLHHWIGTHELTRICFLRFFKWLHYPNISPSSKRPIPVMMQNIPKIKRREQEIYKPTDLWTVEDDGLFYKYCPSKRDRCWHGVSRDTGCRADELLKLKIKDLVIEQIDGSHVVKIVVNGKTGTREVRICNSYPYLKEWITSGHPYGTNPDAPLFCGEGTKSFGKRLSNSNAIYLMYRHYKKDVFPKILKDPTVLEDDKRKIRELLKKPWNPHIRRHSSATEMSKVLKDDVMVDTYFGWSPRGHTRNRYRHYFSNDTMNAVLTLADGLNVSSSNHGQDSKSKNPLKPIKCPNCDETNKRDSKFCANCRFVLSFDAFHQALQEKDKLRVEEMEQKIQQIEDRQDDMWLKIVRKLDDALVERNKEIEKLQKIKE